MSIEDLATRHAQTVAMRDRILTEHAPGPERRRALDAANSTVWVAERALADEIGRTGLRPGEDRSPGFEGQTSSAWLVAIGGEALALDPHRRRPVGPGRVADPAPSNITSNF